MNKLYIFFLFLITFKLLFETSCKTSWSSFFRKKTRFIGRKLNKSNKNDIRKILGAPSTTSKFDNDVWIYIERKQTQSQLIEFR